MEDIIKQRYRRRGSKQVGDKNVILVAVRSSTDDRTFNLGYAVRKPGDRPDKYFGADIAISRAESDRPLVIPKIISKDDVKNFIERCERYFKGRKASNFSFEAEKLKEKQEADKTDLMNELAE